MKDDVFVIRISTGDLRGNRLSFLCNAVVLVTMFFCGYIPAHTILDNCLFWLNPKLDTRAIAIQSSWFGPSQCLLYETSSLRYNITYQALRQPVRLYLMKWRTSNGIRYILSCWIKSSFEQHLLHWLEVVSTGLNCWRNETSCNTFVFNHQSSEPAEAGVFFLLTVCATCVNVVRTRATRLKIVLAPCTVETS